MSASAHAKVFSPNGTIFRLAYNMKMQTNVIKKEILHNRNRFFLVFFITLLITFSSLSQSNSLFVYFIILALQLQGSLQHDTISLMIYDRWLHMNKLKHFLLNSKNINKSSFIWNMAGSMLMAFQSVIMLMIITRTLNLYEAGVFTLAYASANLFLNIGKYGMRNFQVSDVKRQFNFKEYNTSRIITTQQSVCTARLQWNFSQKYSGNPFLPDTLFLFCGRTAYHRTDKRNVRWILLSTALQQWHTSH